MKKILLLVPCFFLLSSFYTTAYDDYEECDIVVIYTAVDVDSGTKAIDSWGDLVEIENVLIPNNDIKNGSYEVEVTKKKSNLYQIVNTDLYIETKFCHEFAIRNDAILIVDKGFLSKGKILFLK